jgi:hypothetical protein
MSNRTQVFTGTTKNPASKFLDWKSNDKQFAYYDKEQSKMIEVKLPLKFVFLDELHTVKGWNDASSSGVYANEVKFISKEPMTVKAFKGGEIAKGLYNEIKDKAKNAGGHYVKSIYIMLEDGSLANIQLKGSAVQGWGEFVNANKKLLTTSWIVVDKTIEGKKGAVKYTTPSFVIGDVLTVPQSNDADSNFDTLEAYLKIYLTKVEEVDASNILVEVEDDLEF